MSKRSKREKKTVKYAELSDDDDFVEEEEEVWSDGIDEDDAPQPKKNKSKKEYGITSAKNRKRKSERLYHEQKNTSDYTDTKKNKVLKCGNVQVAFDRRMVDAMEDLIGGDKTFTPQNGKSVFSQCKYGMNGKSVNQQIIKFIFKYKAKFFSKADQKRLDTGGDLHELFKSNGSNGVVGEHKSGNKLNFTESNYNLAVMGKTNVRFQDRRESGNIAKKQSEVAGVTWYTERNKWRVQLRPNPTISGKLKYFGYYEDEEEAIEVALDEYDAGHSCKDCAPWRTILYFYKNGKFAPWLKTFTTFRGVARAVRPSVYK